MRVLVVEDYPPLLRSLTQGLREAGYAVDAADSGTDGLAYARAASYDALVLDVMLPGIDGLQLLARLRASGSQAPVLLLTAQDGLDDRVRGLDGGADDYMVKPFAFTELLARLRALIRRSYRSAEGVIRVADLEIDTAARSVRRGGKTIVLSAKEYALLEYLASRRGQVVTRPEIWDHVYDFAAEPGSNVIDVYVGYLRKKIDDAEPRLIHTRRGLGYVLGVDP